MSGIKKSNQFQKLENEITGLASLYFQALTLVKGNSLLTRHHNLINTIREAYASLSSEERTIINNEFFYQKYPFWWKSTYSSSVFKKLKLKSMSHFLEEFYNEAI